MATAKKKATKTVANKLPYVIVRATRAGVVAGELESLNGEHAIVRNARQIWRWEGAATLHELAVYGAKVPSGCKFSVVSDRTDVLDACEIIYCQPAGEKMIREQAPWRA